MHINFSTTQETVSGKHCAVRSTILFQPQFQPEGIDAVQVVSKKPFVAYEAKFLVQVKSWTVGDLSLQYYLQT